MRLSLIGEDKDKNGGIKPTPATLKKYAHADLITLPAGVSGTNCGNCRYISNHQGKHTCLHPDLQGLEVNSNMCCRYWDNPKVERAWAPDKE
jgi:hypothetical protein